MTTKTTSFARSETVSSVYKTGAGDHNDDDLLYSSTTSFSISDDRGIKSLPGPELPPLLIGNRETHDIPSADLSRFSTTVTIPPMKSVASLAGTGCSCGFTCACPGCIEHRVPSPESNSSHHPRGSSLSNNLTNCVDGCGTCVASNKQESLLHSDSDPHSSATGLASPSQSVMEEFLARAASLPPPPRNRVLNLDPTNTTVFPSDMFTRETQVDPRSQPTDRMDKELTWGLVNIPKLDCCGGNCVCPDQDCGCGRSCEGSCSLDTHNRVTGALRDVKLSGNIEVDNAPRTTPPKQTGTCCGVK
jgi:hypothetical protein